MKSDPVTPFPDEEEAELAEFPLGPLDCATALPEGDTCQFVATVAPAAAGTAVQQMPTLLGRFTEHLDQVEGQRRRLDRRARELENQTERHRIEHDRLCEAIEVAKDENERLAAAVAKATDDVRRSEVARQCSDEQLTRTMDELARCQLERRFLRDDLLVKDAYLATLREQATRRNQADADIRALTETLADLTAAHAAETARAAALVLANREVREQLARAEQELHRAHVSFAETLAQPRYVFADRCNAWARKARLLHIAAKHAWSAWHRGR
jgi:septal ring factor EnvC (AmiA/AmiB activator)